MEKSESLKAGWKTTEFGGALGAVAAALVAAFGDADPYVRLAAILVVGAVATAYILSRGRAKAAALVLCFALLPGCALFDSSDDDLAQVHAAALDMRDSWRGYHDHTVPSPSFSPEDRARIEGWGRELTLAFDALVDATARKEEDR